MIQPQTNLNFCANSARLLRKLDHVLLWILSNDTRLLQCSLCPEKWQFQWPSMFYLNTLPLSKPAPAKIQMLTAICSIVKLIPWNEVNLSHLYLFLFFIMEFAAKKKSTVFGWKNKQKMAHHRALLASSVMTDYLWMRMITPCIIDPEIPKARRGLTVKGQAICKESSIRFPSGRVVLIWMEHGTSEGAGGFPKR